MPVYSLSVPDTSYDGVQLFHGPGDVELLGPSKYVQLFHGSLGEIPESTKRGLKFLAAFSVLGLLAVGYLKWKERKRPVLSGVRSHKKRSIAHKVPSKGGYVIRRSDVGAWLDDFGKVYTSDVGRKVWRQGGRLMAESHERMRERQRAEAARHRFSKG